MNLETKHVVAFSVSFLLLIFWALPQYYTTKDMLACSATVTKDCLTYPAFMPFLVVAFLGFVIYVMWQRAGWNKPLGVVDEMDDPSYVFDDYLDSEIRLIHSPDDPDLRPVLQNHFMIPRIQTTVFVVDYMNPAFGSSVTTGEKHIIVADGRKGLSGTQRGFSVLREKDLGNFGFANIKDFCLFLNETKFDMPTLLAGMDTEEKIDVLRAVAGVRKGRDIFESESPLL